MVHALWPTSQHHTGSNVLRFIMWIHTTPAMVFLLAKLSDFSNRKARKDPKLNCVNSKSSLSHVIHLHVCVCVCVNVGAGDCCNVNGSGHNNFRAAR
jgi:hypothetical protein